MTHREFIRKYPEFRHLPEFITGAGEKRVRLMDATYPDLVHYQGILERRIARRERLRALRTGKAFHA